MSLSGVTSSKDAGEAAIEKPIRCLVCGRAEDLYIKDRTSFQTAAPKEKIKFIDQYAPNVYCNKCRQTAHKLSSIIGKIYDDEIKPLKDKIRNERIETITGCICIQDESRDWQYCPIHGMRYKHV